MISSETRCFCLLRKSDCFSHALAKPVLCFGLLVFRGQRLLPHVFRASARLVHLARSGLVERGFFLLSSVVSRFSVLFCSPFVCSCCVTHLTRPASMAQENFPLARHHISHPYTKKRNKKHGKMKKRKKKKTGKQGTHVRWIDVDVWLNVAEHLLFSRQS